MKGIVKHTTGELQDSISWRYDEATGTGIISVGADYAMYVEYGTGVVGLMNPHPQPAPGWVYDVNGHGESGWTYLDQKTNRFYHTKGQPAGAFAWKTAQYIQQRAKEISGKDLLVSVHV